MPETKTPAADKELSYVGNDLPFYNGIPIRFSGMQWWFLVAMTVLGFLVFTSPLLPTIFGHRSFFTSSAGQFIPAILYFAIPLAGLAMMAGNHWTAIFRPVTRRDVFLMFAFALFNLAVTLPLGYLVSRTLGAQPNSAIAGLRDLTAFGRTLFVLKTAPSLFGEEVMTILPFLALMHLFFSKLRCQRKTSLVWAWLVSAILFGLAHLPTYHWDLVQCLVVIGSARLVLSLAYIMTKNLWVSTGAHIINDWTFFGLTMLGASLSRGS